LIKLNDLIELISGQSPKSNFYNKNRDGIPFFQGKTEFGLMYLNSPVVWTKKTTNESIKGDVLLSVRAPVGPVNLNPFDRICIGRGLCALRGNDRINNKFLFYYLFNNQSIINGSEGAIFQSISRDQILSIKVPVPPKNVQEKIVSEIEQIEKRENEALKKKDLLKSKINELFEEMYSSAKSSVRLSDSNIFDVFIGKRILKNEISASGEVPVYSANVFEPFGYIDKYLITDFSKPSVLWGIDGDWMVSVLPKGIPFYPTDHCGVLRIKNNMVNEKYLAYALNKEGQAIGFSRNKRASIDRITGIKIPLLSISEQQKMIKKIEKVEKEIESIEKIIGESIVLKLNVIRKYL
jgi:restriction endonuclease S subunit